MNIKIHIGGEENLSKISEFNTILAANHVSYIDPLIVSYAYYKVKKRLPIFIMKKGLAGNAIGKFCLVTVLNHIAIDRDRFSTNNLREIGDRLKKENLLIYPQGTLKEELLIDLDTTHKGASFLAKFYKINILPSVHIGCDKIYPCPGKIKIFSKKIRNIYIKFLPAIESNNFKNYADLNIELINKMNLQIKELDHRYAK